MKQRHYLFLLVAITFASIGEWIYLIALNLYVYQTAAAPALAVAVLYMIKPAAVLFTNSWSGSLIDRMNKRKLIITAHLVRLAAILVMALAADLPFLYVLVFFVSCAGCFVEPALMALVTANIPAEERKQFNAYRGIADSAGFIVGPAVAGVLVGIGSAAYALLANALLFGLAAGLISMVPVREEKIAAEENTSFSLNVWLQDWRTVLAFSRKNLMATLIISLFTVFTVMTAAVDSLEVAFSTDVLHLSEAEYGLLVSVAGIGFISGALLVSLTAKKAAVFWMLGGGALIGGIAYVCYAFSTAFLPAAISFFVLSAGLVWANTGYVTFFQEAIPVGQMGRMSSLYQVAESLLIIAATAALGAGAGIFSIKAAVITGCMLMLVFSILLVIRLLLSPRIMEANEIKKRTAP